MGKTLSVCDLLGGLLVEMDEKAGFIFGKTGRSRGLDTRLSSSAPAHTIPEADAIASRKRGRSPGSRWLNAEGSSGNARSVFAGG
jgi:hypothetical protein